MTEVQVMFDLTLVLPNQDKESLRVDARETVRQLKGHIEHRTRILKPLQRLEFRGDDDVIPLLDHVPIEQQIPDNAWLHLYERENANVDLKIKTLDAKSFDVKMDTYDQISDIINSLNSSNLVDDDACADLVFRGQKMVKEWTIEDYNMPDGATLYCIIQLTDFSKGAEPGSLIVHPIFPKSKYDEEFDLDYDYTYMAGYPKPGFNWPYHYQYTKATQYPDAKKETRDHFDINVILPNKKSIVLAVKKNHTIRNLKQVLSVEEGLHVDYLLLKFDGKTLSDRKRVGDYNIKQGNTIEVIKEGAITVNVRAVPVEVVVNETQTVADVKRRIAERTGWDEEFFHLATDRGVRMDEPRTLGDYNVKENGQIRFIPDRHQQRLARTRTHRNTVNANELKVLEVRSKHHGFAVPWPEDCNDLKEMISDKADIEDSDLLITEEEDGDLEDELDDIKLVKLMQEKDEPLVYFRLRSEEPDNTVNCSIQ